MLFSFLRVLVASRIIAASSVSAAPFSPFNPLVDRQATANCKTPQFGLSTSCWGELNLTQYVTNWWQKNGPGCGSTGFAPCFLNAQGMATMQCDVIVNDACTAPNPKSFNDSRAFYVAYNIYAINQFFNTYYTAIGSANTLALENVPSIIQTIDPPKTQNVELNDILVSLSMGLSFIMPESRLVMGLVNAAMQSVTVSKFLFPIGSVNSQAVALATVDQQLGLVTQQLQGNISQAVTAILHDADVFLNFTSGGDFSVAPNATIFSDTQVLLTGLNTFIVSQALQANSIVLTRGLDTNISAYVQANSADLNYNVPDCANGYDAQGICDAWWYDPGSNTSFALMNTQDASIDYHAAMETIFSNWTSPTNLFLGANACHAANMSQNPDAIVSVTPQGGINLNCLSNMQVCTWDQDSNNWNTEFSDCPNEAGLLDKSCEADGGTKVPYGYIGPWMAEYTSLSVCR